MVEAPQLRLPTPGQDAPPGATPPASSEHLDAEARRQSRAFSFPFARAYDIQLDLMKHIFRAIEDRQVGVFESPTGTGKSLSLICSAFTWLRLDQDRAANGRVESVVEEASGEPEWVVKHRQDKVRSEVMAHQEELRRRIGEARVKQAEFRRKGRAREAGGDEWQQRKRLKAGTKEASEDSDAEFIASDVEVESGSGNAPRRRTYSFFGGARAAAREDPDDEYSNLSPEVRALMAQLDAGKKARGPVDEAEEPETLPRIVYASRTHSQLAQFVAELRKTDFGKRIKVTSHWSQDRSPPPQGSEDQDATETSEPIRTISLGSRKQMCINAEVQKLGERAGAEAMNERCLELLKGGGSGSSKSAGNKKRCDFLPPQDDLGRSQILEFRDHAMAEVADIEDLVQLGREMKTCPYFAARNSARQAELITLPYNLLLQKDARQSLGISFKGCVVLIDEAHNLIDNILSTHTVTVTSDQIDQAAQQIQTYLDRFALRLKGSNEAHLRQMMGVLGGLQNFCTRWLGRQKAKGALQPSQRPSGDEIVSASQLVTESGGTLDRINVRNRRAFSLLCICRDVELTIERLRCSMIQLVELERWMKETQIARKVSGYADKQAQRKRAEEIAVSLAAASKVSKKRTSVKQGNVTTSVANSSKVVGGLPGASAPSPIAAMHAIESFVLSLANRTEDGRVLLSMRSTPSSSGTAQSDKGPTVALKYQLLNPSHVFKTLLDEARSVILAGGTMEPISDFQQQLVPTLDRERFTTFSCGHIIPSSNLLATVVPSGPRGIPFEFKYENRNDPALLDELGNTLVNLCNLVPDGLVVFLPSYAFLDAVTERWKKGSPATTTIWKRIEAKKRIFLEPKTTREVDQVLREYTLEIDTPKPGKVGGAILFAVVGAKLSEGINFSDQLARGVVMVGMPFPNANSPDLAERMRYVRELAKRNGSDSGNRVDPGKELYTNLCMKAVNQSIGRAIRHREDYASLMLLDRRYGRRDILDRLPKWIGREVVVADRFGSVAQRNGAFFRSKAQLHQ